MSHLLEVRSREALAILCADTFGDANQDELWPVSGDNLGKVSFRDLKTQFKTQRDLGDDLL